MKQWAWLALGLAFIAGMAQAADEKTLEKLEAPAPHSIQPLQGSPVAAIKFVRIVFDLPPEPWAKIRIYREDVSGSIDRLISWKEGATVIRPSTVQGFIGEELRAANIPVDDSNASVFASDTKADFQLGVRITSMLGRFCFSCNRIGYDHKWRGTVIMEAKWEVYSALERKVIATVATNGGYGTPKDGIEGDSERLIYEALKDNLRELINSPDFRRVLTTTSPAISIAPASAFSPITLSPAKAAPAIGQASASVATVFANDGSGSGFLVSDDGYLLTNHHVAGATKYVKLKWSDGKESLGEVIRSDARHDVALIKADAGGRPPLRLRLSKAQVSEAVFAVGSPFGEQFQGSVSKGIVSALRTVDGLDFIQSDVAVNHGNSGGPLLDETGQVIGMTDWGRTQNGVPVGVNLFIPIDDALRTLNLTPPSPVPAAQTAATSSKPPAKP